MTTSKLNLVVLRVRDLNQSRSFYEALGIVFTDEQHETGPVHLAAELGECVLELYPATSKRPPTVSTQLGFTVTSIEQTLAALLDVSAKVLSAPNDSSEPRRAIVSDPDGHSVHLTET
ncbi:MAG: VOC family protein [Planctomycetaceae bacterium]|nr:VOC family protein [Planctomycetaceae bacterium]